MVIVINDNFYDSLELYQFKKKKCCCGRPAPPKGLKLNNFPYFARAESVPEYKMNMLNAKLIFKYKSFYLSLRAKSSFAK